MENVRVCNIVHEVDSFGNYIENELIILNDINDPNKVTVELGDMSISVKASELHDAIDKALENFHNAKRVKHIGFTW